MKLEELKPLDEIDASNALKTSYNKFSEAINAISERELIEEVIEEINRFILELNEESNPKELKTLSQKKHYSLIQLLEKKENLVPRNRYRNLWMILGMTIFGVPFGLIFSMALGNMAYFAIGLPLGMPIGMAIGAQKDKKAKEEGRQLNFEA